MSDWNASRYHTLSEPQFEWGRKVLDRLAPVAGERILDLGCGTGRLTVEIARRTGRVVVSLPQPLRRPFVEALAGLASTDRPPYTLDYWRLNMTARKAGE